MTNESPPSIAINLSKSLPKWPPPHSVFWIWFSRVFHATSRANHCRSKPWPMRRRFLTIWAKVGDGLWPIFPSPHLSPIPYSVPPSSLRVYEPVKLGFSPTELTQPHPNVSRLSCPSRASFLRVYHFPRRRFLTEKSSSASPRSPLPNSPSLSDRLPG